MPAPYRTNTGAVLAVLAPGKEYDLQTNPSLIPFMDAAQQLCNRVAAIALHRQAGGYQPSELEVIERYLAAHFYLTSDKAFANKSDGGASATFMQQTGKRLEQSPHGQTALNLDYLGVLNGINSNARARMFSLSGRRC
jgi:hypothetical protein